MNKMLKFYESLAEAAGIAVTEDGCLSIKTSKEVKPMTIKGQRLVLPTKEHLANPDREHRIIFHPLSENVLRGESIVFERFRNALNARLNVVIGTILYQLLQLGTSPAEHANLNPEQSEFLSKVKNADEKTLNAFKKIVDSVSPTQQNKLFVSIFIKRGGTVGEKRHARVGVVHFPFYNELKKGEPELYGVKLRVKDRESIVGLLDYILPNQDISGVYNKGSDSNIAPSLEALMRGVMSVAGPLNDLIDRFDGIIPANLLIASDWVDTFENLDVLLPEIRSVPMQAGNEGALPGQEGQTAVVATGTPNSVSATPGVSFAQARPAVTWGGAPTATPVPAQATPRTATGGTDFEALLRGSPVLQQAVGFGSSHGWNPGASWQPTQTAVQRASLSNPSAPVNNNWATGGGNQWGNQGGGSSWNAPTRL